MRVDDLIRMERRGELPEFVLFWGGKQHHGIGKSCLSQWYPSPFTADGVVYPTAEHFMMVGKARLFGDAAAEARILADPDPGRAKGAGRTVRGFDETAWIEHRFDIVVAGNRAKFGALGPLRDFLLATSGKVLVEASPYDPIWGIGLSEHQPESGRPSQWRGLNLLGFALMAARADLAA
ncbi:NADAR family protein [Actinomadura sp. HBU206391]|uniref:NADAR family protein n=1 Tax=Actinomadura sp. HBU206391 TaxID=2731692 RepID=UPI00164F2DFB|nr:NADAR family protein [Actinomadura sp. HBU206391]MBC6458347.1 NADAR family protein [Actinomadura sp. HBU206391]